MILMETVCLELTIKPLNLIIVNTIKSCLIRGGCASLQSRSRLNRKGVSRLKLGPPLFIEVKKPFLVQINSFRDGRNRRTKTGCLRMFLKIENPPELF